MVAPTDIQVVGIDIPIGLPDSAVRKADVLARERSPARAVGVHDTDPLRLPAPDASRGRPSTGA